MIREFKLIAVAIRITCLEAIKIIVDDRGVMTVIDVPVEANEVLFIGLNTITWLATGIVGINSIGNRIDAFVVCLA